VPGLRGSREPTLRIGFGRAAGHPQDQPGQHQDEHRKPERKMQQRRVLGDLATALAVNQAPSTRRAVSQWMTIMLAE